MNQQLKMQNDGGIKILTIERGNCRRRVRRSPPDPR
jgi:hypothetical protein